MLEHPFDKIMHSHMTATLSSCSQKKALVLYIILNPSDGRAVGVFFLFEMNRLQLQN